MFYKQSVNILFSIILNNAWKGGMFEKLEMEIFTTDYSLRS